jgi:raffinose/stachyose/melibiose transport system permease protein
MKNKENKLPHLLLLVIGAILILVPIYLTVVSSFKDTPQIMQHFFSLPNLLPWKIIHV